MAETSYTGQILRAPIITIARRAKQVGESALRVPSSRRLGEHLAEHHDRHRIEQGLRELRTTDDRRVALLTGRQVLAAAARGLDPDVSKTSVGIYDGVAVVDQVFKRFPDVSVESYGLPPHAERAIYNYFPER